MAQVQAAVGTIARTIEMLRYLAEHNDIAIKEVSSKLGLAPSTCHRLLEILEREGVVEHDKTRHRYRIGPEFFRISSQVYNRYNIRQVALPFLQKVSDLSNETCVLAVYDYAASKLMMIEQADSDQALRYKVAINVPVTTLVGASGLAVLAFLPQDEIDRIYDEERHNLPSSIMELKNLAALNIKLADIRERHLAVTRGERIPEAIGIFSPVFRADNKIVGSIGITAPELRIKPDDVARMGEIVRTTAAELSDALGATAVSNWQVGRYGYRRARRAPSQLTPGQERLGG